MYSFSNGRDGSRDDLKLSREDVLWQVEKKHLKRMHAILADMSYLILIGQLYLGRRRMFPTPSRVRQGYPDQEKVGAVVAKVIWHSCLYFVIAFYIVALPLSV